VNFRKSSLLLILFLTRDLLQLSGFIASSVYSSACAVVTSLQRPRSTLLVNLAMTAGIYCAIGLSFLTVKQKWIVEIKGDACDAVPAPAGCPTLLW